ncbi:hypothetical protein OC861_005020 [Tilletia horrida]|nr:hypothetical protein OC861_005020 [Tilletia horrida]
MSDPVQSRQSLPTPSSPTPDDVTAVHNVNEGEKDERDPFLVKFEWSDSAHDPRRWRESRKWAVVIISLIFSLWVQMISSMYAPAVEATAHDLGVGIVSARVGQAIFLYGLAVGPIFIAPLSEDYGRKPVLLACAVLLGIFQIPLALTSNLGVFLFFRFLGGVVGSSAFNVVGAIADLWPPEQQGWAVNTFALWVEIGAVPETRAGVLLARRAAKKRKDTGDDRYYAQHERLRQERSVKMLLREVLIRPVFMLFTEPIVWSFAAFDGINYAVLYLALESFPLIYGGFRFSLVSDPVLLLVNSKLTNNLYIGQPSQQGAQNLAFIPFAVGFCIAYVCYPIQLALERRALKRSADGEMPPEARLLWCLGASPLFAVSLFIFAWTCRPEYAPWIASMIGTALYGAASHVIFIAVSDYTIAAYSLFAASAVGGQSFAREFLSGSVTLFSEQMYTKLGYQWASTLLALVATLLAIVPFVLYAYGPTIRKHSSYHEEIVAHERQMRIEFKQHETQRQDEEAKFRTGT